MQAEATLCKCPSERKGKIKNSPLPFFNLLLIAILPKCPFCMLAYSTAITVCSTQAIAHTTGWASYISISLALITLLIVLYNFKGKRTLLAASLILLGTIFISYSELITGNVAHYYWGSAALLVGVWANGSFLFFVKLLKSKFFKSASKVFVYGQN